MENWKSLNLGFRLEKVVNSIILRYVINVSSFKLYLEFIKSLKNRNLNEISVAKNLPNIQ
jgi:hypothetical protein